MMALYSAIIMHKWFFFLNNILKLQNKSKYSIALALNYFEWTKQNKIYILDFWDFERVFKWF